MGKLWQKETSLDSLMEEFSVGNDYVIDQELVKSDILGSMAHAQGIHRARLLSDEELDSLLTALRHLFERSEEGSFLIRREDEDCHTALEGYLTEMVGTAGKKIHTGRSRNDQVQTALRIWMREKLLTLHSHTLELSRTLHAFARRYEMVPMAGRTHMQIAMPSSVGLWAASFSEQLLDLSGHLLSLYHRVDMSPLGSAASYGSPVPIDRSYTAQLLGFKKIQRNVLYANNSRGLFEGMILDGCDYIALTLSKLAQDLILFSLPEFGYFSLNPKLCTGSSIMPQKKNPDGLELTRSRSSMISAYALQVKSIIRSLPSGYNRDFQDTKEPFIKGMNATVLLVQIMNHMMNGITVHEDALTGACTGELYATDEVLKRLAEGRSFRDVYREVGMDLDSVASYDPQETLKTRTSEGTTGNLLLEELAADILEEKEAGDVLRAQLSESYRALFGSKISLA